jgi:hypothetical protein
MLSRKLSLRAGLMLAGLAYFQFFAQLEVHPLLKNYLIIVPVQVAALLYVGYVYWLKAATREGEY